MKKKKPHTYTHTHKAGCVKKSYTYLGCENRKNKSYTKNCPVFGNAEHSRFVRIWKNVSRPCLCNHQMA